MIKVNLEHLLKNIDFSSYEEQAEQINVSINNKTGKGNDYLGWADYPLCVARGSALLLSSHGRGI